MTKEELQEGIANYAKYIETKEQYEQQMSHEIRNKNNELFAFRNEMEKYKQNNNNYLLSISELLKTDNLQDYKNGLSKAIDIINKPVLTYVTKDLNSNFVEEFNLYAFNYSPEEKNTILKPFNDEEKKVEEIEQMKDGSKSEKCARNLSKKIIPSFVMSGILFQLGSILLIFPSLPKIQISIEKTLRKWGTVFYVFAALFLLIAIMNIFRKRKYSKQAEFEKSEKEQAFKKLINNDYHVINPLNSIFNSKAHSYEMLMLDKIKEIETNKENEISAYKKLISDAYDEYSNGAHIPDNIFKLINGLAKTEKEKFILYGQSAESEMDLISMYEKCHSAQIARETAEALQESFRRQAEAAEDSARVQRQMQRDQEKLQQEMKAEQERMQRIQERMLEEQLEYQKRQAEAAEKTAISQQNMQRAQEKAAQKARDNCFKCSKYSGCKMKNSLTGACGAFVPNN